MKKQIYTLTCKECGKILAYSLQPFSDANPQCFLCMHNFCDIASALELPNLPDHLDLYRADSFESARDRPTHRWRNAIIQWKTKLREQRNLTVINKLLDNKDKMMYNRKKLSQEDHT